jgi:hypothetical protein
MIVGSFKLGGQHRFEFKVAQETTRIELSLVSQLVRLGAEVPMRTQHVSQKITWLAQCAAFAFAASSIEAAKSGIITFQESSARPSENASVLIGHWRKTTISYTGPIDEHLVLRSDGTVENWTATAYERREPVTGHWSVEGKTLTLSFGGNDRSSPFTFYQGQLVFPNIPNRRGFWEKIE